MKEKGDASIFLSANSKDTKIEASPFSSKVINITKNTTLAESAEIADNLFKRLKGLMGRPCLEAGAGMLLKPCNSIHTFFMRFPIDVAFMDRKNQLIKIYHSLEPWRISGVFFNALYCLELPAGTLVLTHTQEGDFVQTAFPA